MRRIVIGAVLGVFGLLAGSAPAAADLIGQSVTATYQNPVLGTVYGPASWSPPSFTVGGGTETIGTIEGVTTITVDFAATSLTLLLNTVLSGPVWNSNTFNGPVFTAALPLGIAGATTGAGTTMAGFSDSRIGITGNEIRIDWGGLGYVSGTQVVVDFSFTPVPEPASLALLGAGLLGLLVARRRPSPALPA